MKTWWISPLILALGFAGWQAYPRVQQWYYAPAKAPSAKAVALSKSMLNHPGWRNGKNGQRCIVNEELNIVVALNGTVSAWKEESYLKTFSGKEDKALLEETYREALLAIESRLMAKLFENGVRANRKRDASEIIGISSNECQELIPAPRDEDAIQEELDPIRKSITEIKEPKRRDRAMELYKQLLETLDITPKNR